MEASSAVRTELTEVAQRCYDDEFERRGLDDADGEVAESDDAEDENSWVSGADEDLSDDDYIFAIVFF